MIRLGNFIVVLDACIIYDSVLRDMLLRIAEKELYQVRWSSIICDEVCRNLIKRPNITAEKVKDLIDIMNIAFPEAQIDSYSKLNNIDEPNINEKDRHVLAAAVCCSAQVIVTNNLKDFPNNILEQYGIEAQSPDLFLQNIFDLSPERVTESFKEMEMDLKNPPISREEHLKRFTQRVPEFTELLKYRLKDNVIRIH